MIFANRREAGRMLAVKLRHLKDEKPVVMALVRGGLPVAFEVAGALDAPLDIVLVRKIGAPGNPEFAAGAIADGTPPEIAENTDVVGLFGITEDYIKHAAEREIAEIERRRALYLDGRPRLPVADRTVVVVDDGIATGMTTRAALRALRREKPARLVLAVPVAAADSVEALRDECDQIVCLTTPDMMGAIGFFYEDFSQVGDDEVIDMLRRAAERTPLPAARKDREKPAG